MPSSDLHLASWLTTSKLLIMSKGLLWAPIVPSTYLTDRIYHAEWKLVVSPSPDCLNSSKVGTKSYWSFEPQFLWPCQKHTSSCECFLIQMEKKGLRREKGRREHNDLFAKKFYNPQIHTHTHTMLGLVSGEKSLQGGSSEFEEKISEHMYKTVNRGKCQKSQFSWEVQKNIR